ncbi:hypothetical protein QP028_15945 [Corynebacterium suedekumii]|nr:hypothetical protein QP028_15945 [Corynebacterium suedekumii]
MTSVLMVLTAAAHWTLKDGSTHPTGFALPGVQRRRLGHHGGHPGRGPADGR